MCIERRGRTVSTMEPRLELRSKQVGPWPVNSFALVCPATRHSVLIDPGAAPDELIEMLAGSEPSAILVTHTHPDHCEANQSFVDKSGAEIAVHRLEDEYLQGEGREVFGMFGIKVPRFNVTFHLADNLGLGNISLKVLHTPGHSPGSVSLYWQGQKVLICGDLIFLGGVGRADLPGGDPELLKRSIERVSGLEIEYLLPGHGRIIKGKENVNRNVSYCLKMMQVMFV